MLSSVASWWLSGILVDDIIDTVATWRYPARVTDVLDKVRQLVKRLHDLDAERAELEAQLAEIRKLTSGPALERKGRRSSRHGRALRKGSAAAWAETAIRHAGKPVHIDDLVEAVSRLSDKRVQKSSLVSNLSRYVRAGAVFSRPAEGFYSLVEIESDDSRAEAFLESHAPAIAPPRTGGNRR